MSEQMAKG